jgi:alpha-1,2-mannosyltransferase
VFLTKALIGLLSAWVLWHRWQCASARKKNNHPKERVIAFFHPYCSSGGGGERVLWAIIQALGEINEQGLAIQVVVYTVDPPTDSYKAHVVKKVKDRFSLSIPDALQISFLHLDDCEHFLERSSYLSLLLESWGTMRLAYVALKRSLAHCPPTIFFDTTGCAFTYLVASVVFGCKVIAYVHYPTISTDMLSMVWERRRVTYNNQANITNSRIKTYFKLVYYTIFAAAYGTVGSLCSLVLVNSTWTFNHVQSLWWFTALTKRIHIAFPPCRISSSSQSSDNQNSHEQRKRTVLSIGQFRPEKDHELQIESLATLFDKHPTLRGDVKMVMVGGCRNAEDEERLRHLQGMTKRLNLESSVDFVVNQPYSVVEKWLCQSSVGVHTMWNEHFGIGVVEMMSAGLITIAHNSGGPKSDIVTRFEGKPTGLLASTADEYGEAMFKAFTMDEQEVSEMRRNARLAVARFSDEEFNSCFKREIMNSKLLQ